MDTLILKEGDIFFLADATGQARQPPTGLYRHDTQFASRYAWSWRGRPLPARPAEPPQPWRLRLQGAADGVEARRRLAVAREALHEELELAAGGSGELRLEVATRFRDVFEIRGLSRPVRGVDMAPSAAGRRAVLAYRGRDGLTRRLVLHVDPPPDAWEPRRGDGDAELGSRVCATWRVRGGAHLRVRVCVLPEADAGSAAVGPPHDRELRAPPALAGIEAAAAASYAAWLRELPRVECANPGLARVVERSLLDLRCLLEDWGHGPIPVAGLPWFAAPFGRDALIAAYQLIYLHPGVARATLRTLAAWQGTRYDPPREEQPGKIPHELRRGELARLGEVPFGRHYGSADATPLFLVLLGEYWRWTADRATVADLLPAVRMALAWLERDGDADGDGLLEFAPHPGSGLAVQSWKDSRDSMRHRDGSLAAPPLAVCEVQGYAYDGWRRVAEVCEHLGDPQAAAALRSRARALKRRFARAFWSPARGYVALALDGHKRPLETLTSDPGHCLWSGVLPRRQAEAVARRLLEPELWSGWGIRTLAAGEVAYDPLSYHNGSVWPHDTALAAAGLRRYGFDREAGVVAEGLLAAALRFPQCRLPELFGGHPRAAGDPVPYPGACAPQAWAAGAPLLLLRVLLGLEADAARGVLYVRPALPDWVGTVRVTGLRVGDGLVDLEARADRVRVLRREGGCRVVRGSPYPEARRR